MGRAKPKHPSSQTELDKWKKAHNDAIKVVMEENKLGYKFKRKPIDTWEFIDTMGFTLEEFRVLYVVANSENWYRKTFKKGCYLSADTIAERCGMGKTKVHETLKILREANIIELLGRKLLTTNNNKTFAGQPNEYRIKPFDKWKTPPQLVKIRARVQNKEIS